MEESNLKEKEKEKEKLNEKTKLNLCKRKKGKDVQSGAGQSGAGTLTPRTPVNCSSSALQISKRG